MNRFGERALRCARIDNYPDDIRQHDEDPRSPFYIDPEEREMSPDDYNEGNYEIDRNRDFDGAFQEEEEQYQLEQDKKIERTELSKNRFNYLSDSKGGTIFIGDHDD